MSNKKLTIDEVEALVENAISEDRGVTVESVEPNSDGDYCTVILYGDVYFSTLRAMAKAVGDEPIISGEEYSQINLFFRIPTEDEVNSGDDDDDESEEDKAPRIPENMRHDEEYYDSKDLIIPYTQMNSSKTEQNDKIKP